METALRARAVSRGLLLVLAAATGVAVDAAEPSGKQAVLLEKLRRNVESVDARLGGVLGVCVLDLTTGATLEIRADEPFPAASTIKLAVLYELYRQAQEGRVDLATVVAPPASPVGSAGILRSMHERSRLALRDLGLLVMSLSDNEAANELVRRVGMEAVNRRMDALSLHSTRLRRLMMDTEAARRGLENVTTPREIANLVHLVASGHGLRADLARDLAEVATVPDPGSHYRLGLPPGQRAVTKPGTLEAVRCEAAWVDLPGRPYAAAILSSYLSNEKDGEAAISEIAALVHDTFARLAASSSLGRAIGPDGRK
jgi:beta-lactamase class A